MTKCEICGKKIDVTFLNKIIGTHIKDKKGKKHTICFGCQKTLGNKQAILDRLKL